MDPNFKGISFGWFSWRVRGSKQVQLWTNNFIILRVFDGTSFELKKFRP